MTCGELMTPSPTCAQASHSVADAAELMKREDVGLLPVVRDEGTHLIGVLTDRDIVMQVVAAGRDPRTTRVEDAMTSDPLACRSDEPLETVMELMATHQVRRMPIVDDNGDVVGIVAQADLATRLRDPREAGEVVQAISEPEAGV
jgi:CBS domain-containing protein